MLAVATFLSTYLMNASQFAVPIDHQDFKIVPGFFPPWSRLEVNLSHDLRRGANAKGQAGGCGLRSGKTPATKLYSALVVLTILAIVY